MRLRRENAANVIDSADKLMSLTAFPMMGVADFIVPKGVFTNEASMSFFVPDEAINLHPRFKTLTRNIRKRRGKKVDMRLPIYRDSCTPNPFIQSYPNDSCNFSNAPVIETKDEVYLDCMAFGMGCCCLQITFQACNVNEARILYDQLAVLCPILLAMTASSPIQRGYLTDRDCRWNIISGSVDDRTPEEMGEIPLKHDKFRIQKSRYSSIDTFISALGDAYNDIDLVYDKEIYKVLLENDIDHLLARHIAHLFIRDPLVIYKELLNQDNSQSSDHFENIQSTNWRTMRFKPPPPNSTIGWRVEFRPMEAQLSDFENAAFSIFIVLLTRVISSYRLNLLIPLSKVLSGLRLGG